MQLPQIRQRLLDAGALPVHVQRVLRAWAQALPPGSGRSKPEHSLPLRLRETLPGLLQELDTLAQVRAEHAAADGSARLLVALADGQTVESVLLPRDGACVSTQVGCAVGCRFCMTGRDGLLRQLTGGEIVAQVVLARRRRPVRKVVFMGMGEPAHNLEAVMQAIELLGTLGGIGHKNLVFSTVGDARVFEHLPRGPVKPALALSLHTTKPALRAQLLPRAPRLTPAELVDAGERYARATGYPIQYQWTLLDGVNDTDDEVEALIALLRGKRGMLNLIPYNTNEGLGYARPPIERTVEMARRLNRGGVLTRLRQSAGQDVDGGCGQLGSRGGRRPVPLVPAMAPAAIRR
jgi:23S rRNA (adenine2503-C2)-methyltransferase